MGKKSRRRRGRQQSEQSASTPTEVQQEDQPTASSPEVQQEEQPAGSTLEVLPEEQPPVSSPEIQPEEELASLRREADDLIDRFKEATRRFPDDPWNSDRVECWYLYYLRTGEVRFSQDGFATKRDRKFLSKLKQEHEPAFYRATALFLLSCVYFYDGSYRFQTVVDYTDRAVAICDSASMEDKERILNLPERNRQVKAGDFLDELRLQCQYPDIARRIRRSDFDFGFPGIQCDGCGEHRLDLGLSELRSCTSCKLVHYCSKKCQEEAWHNGHKHMCRKPGVFKVGDVVYIRETVEMVTGDIDSGNVEVVGNFRVGQRVRIVGPHSVDTGKLVVEKGDVFGVVSVGDLQRCESPRWYLPAIIGTDMDDAVEQYKCEKVD